MIKKIFSAKIMKDRKKKCFLLTGILVMLFAMLFVMLFAMPAQAIETVDNVRPPITAVFQEKVSLIRYFLINTATGREYPLELTQNESNKAFLFEPTQSLINGMYRFTLYAKDLVGNTKEYTYDFSVYVAPTRITLVRPNVLGVANATTFPVVVRTSMPSVCKYTGIAVDSFGDVRLKKFDITGNLSENIFELEHTINAYSVEPDFPRRIYVVCRDEIGRDNTENFLLYSDIKPPELTSVIFNPSPLVEYPPGGGLFSTLQVVSSEPVICKYTQNEEASYEEMNLFEGFEREEFNAYSSYNEQLINFRGDITKETLTFYVQCEDRAGFRSSKITRPITIDLTEGLKIGVNSPLRYSNKQEVFLNITTNKRAYCYYKSAERGIGDPTAYTEPGSRISSFENMTTNHQKYLGRRPPGTHTLSIRCDVPEGIGIEPMTAEASHTYTIDTTPPQQPRVNATTPVCTNTLAASFYSNDTESGIREYIWAAGAAGRVFANGTTTGNTMAVSQYSNGSIFQLSETETYVFSVQAVDAAGNTGAAGVSNPITYDAKGTSCDKNPPVVTLLRSETGELVTLECVDQESECTSIGSYYGTAYIQPCNTTQYFLEPVNIPLFRDTIICWSVKDTAGNINAGSEVVSYNKSLLSAETAKCDGGIDNDKDGYGERCPLGNDCDDTDPAASIGCLNGCIQDTDGDGYGAGCDAGNDCNGINAELTTICPNGCISDNDGDGYGLGCSLGTDCKGDDSTLTINCPNGCISDNDGDSYGLGCPAGFDCNGENSRINMECSNGCISDSDGDGYGIGCINGLDCSGMNPKAYTNCPNGCTVDEDGDSYGAGCTAGLDCNGMNPLMFTDCPNKCISDHDGDSYGWGCMNGADCNDTDPYTNLDCTETTECKYDHDGDGYGLGCIFGADCNDYNVLITTGCNESCTYDQDCNGMDDVWQQLYFNNTHCNETSICGPQADPDGDGYSNIEEYRRGTNPLQKNTVELPPEKPAETYDEDEDGMPDACEKMYGLNPSDPYDAGKDADKDGLTNTEECNYKQGACINWLNPKSADTDNDGYADKKEIDKRTDPCDPNSKPSGFMITLIMLAGLLSVLGSTGYLIYKKYYLPLTRPQTSQKIAAAPGRTGIPAGAMRQQIPVQMKAAGARQPAAMHQQRMHPRKSEGPATSRELFENELKKRAEEREKMLAVFGEKKEIQRTEEKTKREHTFRKPIEIHRIKETKADKPFRKEETEDHISKLAKLTGNSFEKLAGMTKEEANYFEKLAELAKKKQVSLEEDHVSKLASITKKVADNSEKKQELKEAFQKSAVDDLDEFLSSGKRVDTFIKEQTEEEKPNRKKIIEELKKL
jgi:hypothetical protein